MARNEAAALQHLHGSLDFQRGDVPRRATAGNDVGVGAAGENAAGAEHEAAPLHEDFAGIGCGIGCAVRAHCSHLFAMRWNSRKAIANADTS